MGLTGLALLACSSSNNNNAAARPSAAPTQAGGTQPSAAAPAQTARAQASVAATAAVGTPTIVLFGPTNPAVWAPRGSRVRTTREMRRPRTIAIRLPFTNAATRTIRPRFGCLTRSTSL